MGVIPAFQQLISAARGSTDSFSVLEEMCVALYNRLQVRLSWNYGRAKVDK
ncbi:hypothetical protein C5167_027897 [Papaver somniferum]|nr:hypothetical protein C5167_027897 [Papaver somniferum]